MARPRNSGGLRRTGVESCTKLLDHDVTPQRSGHERNTKVALFGRLSGISPQGPDTSSGVRSDVDAYARYDPTTSTWTLEIRRRLTTDDDKDVQFDDLNREYFGAAIFDNAQIEHSWTPSVFKMVFGN